MNSRDRVYQIAEAFDKAIQSLPGDVVDAINPAKHELMALPDIEEWRKIRNRAVRHAASAVQQVTRVELADLKVERPLGCSSLELPYWASSSATLVIGFGNRML